jgi:hypothetical protein
MASPVMDILRSKRNTPKKPQEMEIRAPVRIIRMALVSMVMGFAWDSYLVRIEGRVVEALLQECFQLWSQQVLHLLGRLVNVVRSDVEKLVEVKFPEAVQANNPHRIGYALGRQRDALRSLSYKTLTEEQCQGLLNIASVKRVERMNLV